MGTNLTGGVSIWGRGLADMDSAFVAVVGESAISGAAASTIRVAVTEREISLRLQVFTGESMVYGRSAGRLES
jgi:hypothetical protein